MVILIWLIFAAVVAAGAKQSGRNPLLWIVIAIIFSPILAFIALMILPEKKSKEDEALDDELEIGEIFDDFLDDSEDIHSLVCGNAMSAADFKNKKRSMMAKLKQELDEIDFTINDVDIFIGRLIKDLPENYYDTDDIDVLRKTFQYEK